MNFGWVNLHFYFFENAWEVKKSKCENHAKCGPTICKMMRGFEIWPQNSNRIIIDPLFGQKTVENRDFSKYPYFRQFFA